MDNYKMCSFVFRLTVKNVGTIAMILYKNKIISYINMLLNYISNCLNCIKVFLKLSEVCHVQKLQN